MKKKELLNSRIKFTIFKPGLNCFREPRIQKTSTNIFKGGTNVKTKTKTPAKVE